MQLAENGQANWQEGWILLRHDNTRLHTAGPTQERIQELQWELLEHPPYSPDLAPRDLHLFGPLKKTLGDKRFTDDEEVQTEVRKWLRLLCCGFQRTDKAKGQVYVYKCWWRICGK
jgi:transposase